ncbi:hypothetical protein RRG08_033003 [Elysia crispata]|uniref:Uncharacterized protein n=1 Tax=Elysia crispata TaxID=231223 RepID=A0AAE1D4F2_9GAST|nr:hypothetical protein RRG08_033003 [Elysia crispata]
MWPAQLTRLWSVAAGDCPDSMAASLKCRNAVMVILQERIRLEAKFQRHVRFESTRSHISSGFDNFVGLLSRVSLLSTIASLAPD